MWPLQQVPFLSSSKTPDLGWWAPGALPALRSGEGDAFPSSSSSRNTKNLIVFN